jgi:hypothetical protein
MTKVRMFGMADAAAFRPWHKAMMPKYLFLKPWGIVVCTVLHLLRYISTECEQEDPEVMPGGYRQCQIYTSYTSYHVMVHVRRVYPATTHANAATPPERLITPSLLVRRIDSAAKKRLGRRRRREKRRRERHRGAKQTVAGKDQGTRMRMQGEREGGVQETAAQKRRRRESDVGGEEMAPRMTMRRESDGRGGEMAAGMTMRRESEGGGKEKAAEKSSRRGREGGARTSCREIEDGRSFEVGAEQ